MENDRVSIFSYDGDEPPDAFRLFQLTETVNTYFGTECSLEKLAEGGFHKVRFILI
jgi:hypothetical protein